MMHPEHKPLFQPGFVDRLVKILYVLCALLLIGDLFMDKHGHIPVEEKFAFHAVYGFLAYCTIVLSAKQLRRLIKRDENYYQEAKRDDA